MRKRLFVFLLFSSPAVYGHGFNLGAASSFSQVTLPQSSGSAIYAGPGYLVDARLRFLPYKERPLFSFDIFAQWGQLFLNNTGASETHQQDETNGGLDINLHSFSFGAQYGRAKSAIHLTSGNYAQFAYDLVGGRLGWRVASGFGWKLMLHALYQTGTAIPGGDNTISNYQKVNQWTGTLTFQYQLIGDKTY